AKMAAAVSQMAIEPASEQALFCDAALRQQTGDQPGPAIKPRESRSGDRSKCRSGTKHQRADGDGGRDTASALHRESKRAGESRPGCVKSEAFNNDRERDDDRADDQARFSTETSESVCRNVEDGEHHREAEPQLQPVDRGGDHREYFLARSL